MNRRNNGGTVICEPVVAVGKIGTFVSDKENVLNLTA